MTDNRPVLLITTIAAATAMASSRIVSLLCMLLYNWISTIPTNAVIPILRWEPVVTFLLVTVAALALPYWLHLRLAQRSLKTNYISVSILLILAACPLHVRIKHELHTAAHEREVIAVEPEGSDDGK